MKKKQSLKVRLWINSLINVVLLVVVGALGVYALAENTQSFERYSKYTMFSSKNAELTSGLMEMRIEVYKYLVNGNVAHLEKVDQTSDVLAAKIEDVLAVNQDASIVDDMKGLIEDFHTYGGYAKQIDSMSGVERSAFISETFAPLGNEMMVFVQDMMQKAVDEQNAVSEDISHHNQMMFTLIGLVGIISLILAVILSIALANSVVKSIQTIIDSLTHSSTQVGSAANEISASSQSLAEASSEQAATVEETSASMEEISSMVKANANAVEMVRDRSNDANKAAQDGNERMKELERKLSSIRDAGNALKEAMGQISKSSKEVAQVAATIDEIAFQTNLLSLNAAVEAARAGEAGAGFAVVAGEVGQLAQRSAQNATQTTQLIAQSEDSSKAGVTASDEVLKSLDAATLLFEEVIKAFDSITTQVSDVSVHSDEVRQSSVQQTQGIEQINTAISQLDQVIQQNAATSEETAGAAAQLTTQSDQLRRVVEQLREVVYGTDSISDFKPGSSAPSTLKMFPGEGGSSTISASGARPKDAPRSSFTPAPERERHN